ncbi:hypothetical protein CLV91_2740 [Maribacter vaceletii]|uniref:Styrene-oxide isomerase n=1 Tax=Maribacter vaceletii TaxID=1206816 RepID=A0A495DTJ8_9FLAO|nr:isomerase [Maribacter vaceletii]RKR07975.1 hypothetical protein CLV91_2740 [Maribacter vaceletii]
MNKKQLKMIGHGSIVLIFGLLAGFGLIMDLIGGFEIYPTNVLQFDIPGDSAAWARAHAGGIMNGMLVILVALVMFAMKLPEKPSYQLYWMLIGTGYANTLFYWGGLAAGAHRALTFGNNQLGETSIAGILGLLPAFIFAFVLLVAIWILMKQAFNMAKKNQ